MRTGILSAVVVAAASLWSSLPAQTTSPGTFSFTLATPVPLKLTEVAILSPQQNQSIPPPTPNTAPVPAMPPYLPQTAPAASLPPATTLRPEQIVSRNAYDAGAVIEPPDRTSSVYIPVDNWVYPEMVRLYERSPRTAQVSERHHAGE